MRRKKLEMLLSGLSDLESPDPSLEQYITPAEMVAEVLYFADSQADLRGKSIAELGCGPAPFAIGAYLMGARNVWACDVDRRMVETALLNISRVRDLLGKEDPGVEYHFEVRDIKDAEGIFPSVDTILMNPPFGAQKKGADRPFIDRALSMANVVHSIHNGPSLGFLKEYLGEKGAVITHVWKAPLDMARRFPFHRKEKRSIDIVAIRFTKE